ncbi:MAG: hypothetical protein JNK27_07275 [Chitinophagaceae bacterium]|nr:hypothetical protein [Chitinophagaceae bacterium]
MEVHHHSHTARKKWTHYFWEFLMLFLAVFAGFLAENEREHFIEHKREKKLVKEMVEDLKKDTVYLNLCVNRFIPNHLILLDSAIRLLSEPGHEKDRETYQAFLTATEWNYNYVPTERTLSQFRSYGYRLIRSAVVADRLSELEIINKVYYGINDYVHALQNEIDESASIIADKAIVSKLFITDYPFPDDVSVDLTAVPDGVTINKTSPDLPSFISRLKKYNYYLGTTLRGDYMRILKFQSATINILKETYRLK